MKIAEGLTLPFFILEISEISTGDSKRLTIPN